MPSEYMVRINVVETSEHQASRKLFMTHRTFSDKISEYFRLSPDIFKMKDCPADRGSFFGHFQNLSLCSAILASLKRVCKFLNRIHPSLTQQSTLYFISLANVFCTYIEIMIFCRKIKDYKSCCLICYLIKTHDTYLIK